MQNQIVVDDFKVRLNAFSYSWGQRGDHVTLHVEGRIVREAISCRFVLSLKGGQHKLTFPEAMIFDGSDPREVALAVKRALIRYLETHDDIPNRFRDKLVSCVRTHHLQTPDKVQTKINHTHL